MHSGATRISRIEAWKCVFDLPEPFPLGNLLVSRRDYVLVRVITEAGIEGVSFGLARNAPVDVVITELLAPHVLGHDIRDAGSLAGLVARRLPQHAPEGLVLRALSHVDIAVWDALGKDSQQPVWRLLGGHGPVVAPIMLVEGYHIAGEDDAHFAARLGERARSGYRAFKIEASGGDWNALARRLKEVRAAVGPDIGLTVDLAYGWESAEEGRDQFGWLDGLDIAWVEDPLHGSDVEGIQALHCAVPVPLAVGDEVTSIRTLRELIEQRATDIVRFDLTCHGGFSASGGLHQAASAAGLGISHHVYPEIHRHAIFGLANSGPVEMFPDNGRWDATAQFIEPIPIRRQGDGTMGVTRPTDPGLGLSVDWTAVAGATLRHNVVDAKY